jgi:hypothetical protein
MQIARRGPQILVPQQSLDHQQIDTVFQQMCGEGVAQGLLILLIICTQQRFVISVIPSMAWKLKSFAIYGEVTL